MTNIDLRSTPMVLLDDSRAPHMVGASLLFHSPDHIIRADTFTEVPAALKAIDAAHADGLHTAGWISYEVAAAFEPRLAARLTKKADEPLIWMIATRHRARLSPAELEELFHLGAHGNQRIAEIKLKDAPHNRHAYLKALKQIQAYIQAGDVYQINHTFPRPVDVMGDPLTLYRKLRANQPVAYGAYIDTGPAINNGHKHGSTKILSLSPELFLEKTGDTLTARPMKGTAPRGANAEEDAAASRFLQQDEKSRAENLMIVDLIRNDLSRIAAKGSVKADRLFQTEKYPTLFQMTSTVTAKAKPGLLPSGLLAAMFPCGSVTGAPKVRAMEIINDLEGSPRGVYCGTIGYFSPAQRNQPESWSLNVPIRTICLTNGNKGRMSIGSGIVADSVATAEYDECMLKARFVKADRPNFALIETLRLENGCYHYLEQHLARLAASAEYFDFNHNRPEIIRALKDHAAAAPAGTARRCRLLVSKTGLCSVTSNPLQEASYVGSKQFETLLSQPPSGTVCVSTQTINSSDIFRRHKTTVRGQFDIAFKDACESGHLDILFLNDKGHLTEGAISNIYSVKGGKITTPPTSDGLLPGIQRADMFAVLSKAQLEVGSITLDELRRADAILIGNAVRGLRRVTL